MITTETGAATIPLTAWRVRIAAIMCSVLSLVAFTVGAVMTALGIAG